MQLPTRHSPIDDKERMSRAGQYVRTLVIHVASGNRTAADSVLAQAFAAMEDAPDTQPLREVLLCKLKLKSRTLNMLEDQGIETLDDFIKVPTDKLLRVANIAGKTVDEVKIAVFNYCESRLAQAENKHSPQH